MSCKVKICGITNVEDALAAISFGADYIGLIFVASSPRSVNAEIARMIIDEVGKKAKVVGVFRDSDYANINQLVRELKLDFVQLHGQESPQYCTQIQAPVIKVLELQGRETDCAQLSKSLESYEQSATVYLFDRPKSDKNSADSDWLTESLNILTNEKSLSKPFFFAGGVNSENVQQVIESLSATSFYGIDTASGVEDTPGKKDLKKLKKFLTKSKGEVLA